jgi:hypothetical protein
MQPIYRVSISDGLLEQTANLSDFSGGDTEGRFFCGLKYLPSLIQIPQHSEVPAFTEHDV